MALDGAFLSVLCRELQAVVGSRIDRIHQPSREEVMMTLRFKGGSEKLADQRRGRQPENPFYQGGVGKSKNAAHVLYAAQKTPRFR